MKKKKTRRAKGKPKVNSLTIYTLNIRGFFSKMDSLSEILQNLNPDVVVINELKTKNTGKIKNFFKERGYEPLIQPKSGMLIACLQKFPIVNVTSSSSPLIMTGFLRDLNIRIIAVYGPQESVSKEDREDFYDELQAEILTSEYSGHDYIVTGDFNAKIDLKDSKLVHKSSNGEMLCQIIQEKALEVLNFHPTCQGYITRVEEVDGVLVKSVLDYCITNKKLSSKLKSIIVDEERILAPFHVKNKKKPEAVQYSDHNPLIIELGVTFQEARRDRTNRRNEETGWKLTSDGLSQFRKLTSDNNTPSLQSVSNYTDLKVEITKLMDLCFKHKGKERRRKPMDEERVTDKNLKSVLKKLLPMLKQGKTEKQIAQNYIKDLKEIQKTSVQKLKSARICTTIKELHDEGGKFSVSNFWKLRKSINSSNVEEKTSIITPDGIEVFNSEGIINEYRKEFKNRLSHRKIDPVLQEYEELTERLLQLRLTVECVKVNEPDFTFGEVESVVKVTKKGTSCGPDLIPPDVFADAGSDLIEAITRVFNHIKNNAKTPDEWIPMLIKTLFKNKGSRKVLKYHRGIFLTCILSKILERLLLKRIEPYTDKIHLLQSGSRRKRSIREVTFILNGLIDHALYLNITLYLTSYDFATCFDSLWLDDSLLSLWDLGIQNTVLSLIYELNKKAEISVKTPFGTAESFMSPKIVKQGTVCGPKLCCASTAEICNEDNEGGASVGSMSLLSSLYVDDCNRINTDINDTVVNHNKFLFFSKRKRQPFNAEKCVILMVNKQRHDSCPTLEIEDHTLNEVTETKIVGDIYNRKGNKDALVAGRISDMKGVVASMFATCSEVTCGIDYMHVMLLLYKTVYVPSMLTNADAWSNLSPKNFEDLERAQRKCLKRILKTASSTPNSILYLEMGILPMKFEIHIKQLIFLHQILSLADDDPVKLMYQQQHEYPYEKNWATNNRELRIFYELPTDDNDIAVLSKGQWSGRVKKVVRCYAHEMLLRECHDKKKTQNISFPDHFTTQQYLTSYSPKVALTIFKIRARSTNCLTNRGSHEKCRLCGTEEETQEHVINCECVREGGRIMSLQTVQDFDVECNGSEDVVEIATRFLKFEKAIIS